MQINIHALSGIRTHVPMLERTKMFHALDRAATVIGNLCFSNGIFRIVDGRVLLANKRNWIRFMQQHLFAAGNISVIPFNATLLSANRVAV
jgi:hypothetical protein